MKFTWVVALALVIQPIWGDAYSRRFANPEMKDHTFLLTFPRSGRTWIFYFFKKILNVTFLPSPDSERFPQERKSKAPYRRTHKPKDLNVVNRDHNRLLVIVRNYRECISRHRGYNAAFDTIMTNDKVIRWYMSILRTYDAWNPENRLLIFYEDLITHPRENFSKIVQFLNIDPLLLDQFMDNYEMHKKQSVKKYAKIHHGSATKGKDVLFQSKKFTETQIDDMNHAVKQNYPDLWENYLNRYE